MVLGKFYWIKIKRIHLIRGGLNESYSHNANYVQTNANIEEKEKCMHANYKKERKKQEQEQ